MADVISRLRLDSGEFDSKIKRAGQEIMAYSEHCRKMGLEMGYANKDAKDFAKALGNMATTSSSARGKINELSEAFVNLKVMYKNMTDEERNNTFGKNLAASLDNLKIRINAAKKDFADVTSELNGKSSAGGGFLSGIGSKMEGALAVFGGNMMTKASEAIVQLGSEMYGMVQQGIELARQGEGIRIAFERLGRGDILDGLREATHGTVTDLELMKAAVKFNDFKLPLDQLGTMLAFAQQKAKDTGQSVDYMVDSIVTGLGRKSLMILDNLGLSAAEIKDRMKETGDMTKAVGAIIRDQMAKAGDYVETAADRAAQANVSLQNKMEELGRKFAPIEEASNQLWTSMKIGILDIIGGPLARMLNELTEAGRQINALSDINGDGSNGAETRTGKALRILREYSGGGKGIEGKRELYNRQVASFQNQEEKEWRKANRLRDELAGLRKQQRENGAAGNLSPLIQETSRQLEETVNRAKAFQSARNEYVKGAQQILNASNAPTGGTGGTGDKNKNTKTEQTELQQNQAKINALTQEYVKLGNESTEAARERQAEIQKEIEQLKQLNGLLELRAEQAHGRLLIGAGDIQRDGLNNTPGTLLKALETEIPRGGLQLDDKAMRAVTKDIYKNSQKEQNKNLKKEQAIEGMGDLIGGVNNVFGGLQQMGIEIPQEISSVMGVLNGILTVVMGIESIITVGQFLGIFHNGGVVRAAGGVVAGNTYSNDQIPALLNAGEVVLNRAQVGNLASQLQGGGMQNLNLTATIKGEQIRLVLNNNGRRTGRGEYVQSRKVR